MPAIPWTTLTDASLNTAKAAALVTALRSAALAESQPDPIPEIISDVVARIRMEIEAGGKTVLSADVAKIPPSLKRLGLRMVLREGQSRLNALGGLPLSEDEVREAKEDLRFLERIADPRGSLTVETPDDPASTPTVQAASPSPLICAAPRVWSAANQDGA